ncbi:hypothetical protein DH2020_048863 [Rehmannia glutinosa]|uniref:Reverse transcriptase Ty1/copia-type domain-containing protein n=1 Tax=Rehmannia glutinosa TaxID=99300 RepID=A0ABR0U4T5_REHGL
MSQPEGFIDSKYPLAVCKLQKSLYGLKQAPKAWFDTLKMFLGSLGFMRSVSDSSLFFKKDNGALLLILVYVDDILLTGDDSSAVSKVINLLGDKFALKTMGEVNYFLGLEATRTSHGSIFLNQSKYLRDLLAKTHLENCKSMSTPMALNLELALGDSAELADPSPYRSTIGALQYLTLTRPDISFAINKLSQFLKNPTINQWIAVKHLLRYLKGTQHLGIEFKPSQRPLIEGYSDADWASNLDDRKSTGGHCIFFGGNLLTWTSKKQHVVSRSSAESEYRSLADTAADIVWLHSLFQELGIHFESPSVIWCDNVSAAALASNPVFHARTKHIEIDVHFIRDKVLNKELDVRFVPIDKQVANIFTKPLSASQFQILRDTLVGYKSVP